MYTTNATGLYKHYSTQVNRGQFYGTDFPSTITVVFNPEPLKFNTVLFTFILGTFVLRIIISIFDTPFIYLAKYLGIAYQMLVVNQILLQKLLR